MYKYTVIISQYYHTRHIFIVQHDEKTFLDSARELTEELMDYKREADCEREKYLGDLDPKYSDGREIRSRYNVNDSGDIYFIQTVYANRAMEFGIEYNETSIRESRGFKSKKIQEAIYNHHSYKTVFEIVKKHFEIA
ncbi:MULTISPECIES: hypothetical protein [Paenibacillus]|uniref:Uncharacterized protein n=1 Tax=Paenibacillus pabuli TaxID=1472 RepID=A0A855Y623_9BACL|nr:MULTISPECIES: hypothetical protein [Paenibacillus]PWW37364.1 hypothetical protein DET56_109250 [Paenibacillus pabuli]PXW05506.1 hypothetical protein DEU73_108249 [Paenibacillus taichungensis]